MATEFHSFLLLPWEIRDQIWNLAIRPALPGTHVFRVSDAADYQDPNDPVNETTSSSDSSICKPRLTAPQCLPPGTVFSPAARAAAPRSWSLNNPSTYLVDSGLWTACKESQLVIDKAFRVRARRQEKVWSQSDKFREKAGRFTLPETATFAARDYDAGRRYLTMFHKQDLVIVQSDDITEVKWDIIWETFPYYIFHKKDKEWKQTRGRARFDDIAVEYNPAWDRPPLCLARNIVASTAEAHSPFTLWFIDYRIKRNPRCLTKAPADRQERVFYASDRRYIEVKQYKLGWKAGHDLKWDTGVEGPARDLAQTYYYKDGMFGGSGAFVSQLKHDKGHFWNLLHTQFNWLQGDCSWIKYGLLACEYI